MNRFIKVTQVNEHVPDLPGVLFLDHIVGMVDMVKVAGKFGTPLGAATAITLSTKEEIIYVAETLEVLESLITWAHPTI